MSICKSTLFSFCLALRLPTCDCQRLPATVYEPNSSMRHAPRASSSIAQRAADATVPSAPPPAPCKSLAVRAGNAHELCHGRCLSRLTDAPRMPRPTSHELPVPMLCRKCLIGRPPVCLVPSNSPEICGHRSTAWDGRAGLSAPILQPMQPWRWINTKLNAPRSWHRLGILQTLLIAPLAFRS
jgi:hypothetical protein